MSEFDIHESAHAGDMIVHMGDSGGVEIFTASGAQGFDAIIGSVRTEPVDVPIGGSEQVVYRDLCNVSVKCKPGTIGARQKIIIKKLLEGDDSQRDRQAFYVARIISVTDAWTSFEAQRDSLAKIQRRGIERK